MPDIINPHSGLSCNQERLLRELQLWTSARKVRTAILADGVASLEQLVVIAARIAKTLGGKTEVEPLTDLFRQLSPALDQPPQRDILGYIQRLVVPAQQAHRPTVNRWAVLLEHCGRGSIGRAHGFGTFEAASSSSFRSII